MKIKHKFGFFLLLALAAILTIILYPYTINSEMMNPKGLIALKERNLMFVSLLLMLIVVVPVFVLTFFICWRYRASNKKAKYDPNWNHNLLAEFIWWGFPFIIILILSIITLKSSYELDPYKPIESNVKPLVIQVVALQWKWLFIYPEQKIATVNFIQVPEKTPINFEITADAPMNSFWVPQLGGQIYAMPGMKTKLHLIADAVGEYRGSSANFSGEGFAGMTFIVKATSQSDFEHWIKSVKESPKVLNETEYKQLLKPSEFDPTSLYSLEDEGLYEQIVMKYMMPMPTK